MVNGETYILGTEDNTSHTKQVWRAITASPGRFLSWLLFHCSSRARGCANKKWIVGAWILNFEKRAWRPYKEKKREKRGGNKVKRKERKTGRRFVFPLDSRTRIDPSISHLQKSFSLDLFAF